MTAPVPLKVRRQQMISRLSYLSEVDLFRDLTPEEVDRMADLTTMTTCSRGQIFYTPDHPGEVLFLLKRGKVQLYRISPEGRKLVIATLDAGAVFGEMPLLAQSMIGTFAEALEDCTLGVMSRADLERVLTTMPQVALRLIEILAQRLTEAEARLEDFAFKQIPARLASLLLRLNQQAESSGEVAGYTHQDLADMVGTYRETITQTLGVFRDQRLVKIGRKRLGLLDLEGLRRIAEG